MGPPETGTSYRTHHFAEEWVRNGHNVTFVGTTFSHLMTKPPTASGAFLESQANGVRYCLLRVPKYKSSGAARALNALAGAAQAVRFERSIVGDMPPDLVIAGSVYQADNWPASRIARKYRAAFFRETRDLWPMTLTQVGALKPSHPFVRLIQAAEDHGYKHADLVCTTLENSFEYMRTRGLTADRFEFMAQSPPDEAPGAKDSKPPEEHTTALAEARARGKFIVIFAGGFNPYADLATLLRAAPMVPEAEFIIIGYGPIEADLRGQLKSENIANAKILGPVSKAIVPRLLEQADAGVVGFLPAPIFKYGVSPNKMFEYMRIGLPTIFFCDTGPNPVSNSGAGIHTRGGSAEAIAEAVRQLMKMSPAERRAMGARGQSYLQTHHHLPTVAARYITRAEAILKRKRS